MNYDNLNIGDSIYVFLRDYRKYYKGTVVKKSNTTVQVEIVLRGTPSNTFLIPILVLKEVLTNIIWVAID
jgi:hypothetical protein